MLSEHRRIKGRVLSDSDPYLQTSFQTSLVSWVPGTELVPKDVTAVKQHWDPYGSVSERCPV